MFHGTCVSLLTDEVNWLGARKNFLWVCVDCFTNISGLLEAGLSSRLSSISDKSEDMSKAFSNIESNIDIPKKSLFHS